MAAISRAGTGLPDRNILGAFALFVIASLATQEPWIIPSQRDTMLALLYLVLVVTVGAFLLYMFVLQNWTASGTSYGFVLIPLVTIVVASTIAGERITLIFLLGGILVLAGVLVGALLPSRQKQDALEECRDRSGQVLPECM
jgi:drug/metabolite transporter (DMT)-like permease